MTDDEIKNMDDVLHEAIRLARADERERCAQTVRDICGVIADGDLSDNMTDSREARHALTWAISAIRAGKGGGG